MKTVLTIAGSDSSGGAGIQADIKTMTAHGVFAMSAVTALTAQNTTGVYDILEVSPEFLAVEIDSVFEDIPPDAVKTGMVASAELIEVIAEKMCQYNVRNLVVDPVMVSTSGKKLIDDSAITVLKERLLPLAAVITPNLSEAEVLTGRKIHTKEDMAEAGKALSAEIPAAVLLKGGHRMEDADDLLVQGGQLQWIPGEHILNSNTHGTGCTLSSAIASNLALGFGLTEAVINAKEYISGALRAMLNLGKGSGPLNHMYCLQKDVF